MSSNIRKTYATYPFLPAVMRCLKRREVARQKKKMLCSQGTLLLVAKGTACIHDVSLIFCAVKGTRLAI